MHGGSDRGTGVPLSFVLLIMDKKIITEKITPAIEERGCFLVGLSVSADNDVTVFIESLQGTVMMEDCVAVNDKFTELFDRDEEDYSLTVSSAGLDMPFAVLQQYKKAVGSMVEVKFKTGKKVIGELISANQNDFEIVYETKEKHEGKKKKEIVRRVQKVRYDEINSVRPYIDFK